MLADGERRALAVLQGEQTVSELAATLDRSRSGTAALAGRLETAGLVEAHRQGRPKRRRRSDAKALEAFAGLTQEYFHTDWPELLAGAPLRVCDFFDTPPYGDPWRAGMHVPPCPRSDTP